MGLHGVTVVLIIGMMLGTEAGPAPDVEFSPKTTAYSLSVPVFGGASAVEGVLTAAGHTAAGNLAGTGQEASFTSPTSSVGASTYSVPEFSGSGGVSTFLNPSPAYSPPGLENFGGSSASSFSEASSSTSEHNAASFSPVVPAPSYAAPVSHASGAASSFASQSGQESIGTFIPSHAPAVVETISETGSLPSQEFQPSSLLSGTPGSSYSVPAPAGVSGGAGSFAEASASAGQDTVSAVFSPVPSYAPPVSANAGSIASSGTGVVSAAPVPSQIVGEAGSFAGASSSAGQDTVSAVFSPVPSYSPPVHASAASTASSGTGVVNAVPFPSHSAPGPSEFAGGAGSFAGASSSAGQDTVSAVFSPVVPAPTYSAPVVGHAGSSAGSFAGSSHENVGSSFAPGPVGTHASSSATSSAAGSSSFASSSSSTSGHRFRYYPPAAPHPSYYVPH